MHNDDFINFNEPLNTPEKLNVGAENIVTHMHEAASKNTPKIRRSATTYPTYLSFVTLDRV